jgi:hypothetical protein
MLAWLWKPHNYRRLVVTEGGIEYENLSRRTWNIAWSEITSVTFYRGSDPYAEALNESSWLLRRMVNNELENIEIVDELPNRRALLMGFRKFLPGFDVSQAKRALRSWKRGYWLCFPPVASAAERP